MYALVALLAAAQPAPALHTPTPAVARGDVKAGPPLVQTFDLAHRGAAGKLTITKVEAGCGCVRRGLSAEVLQPGETAKLSVEINTLTQPDGPNRWQVAVGYQVEVSGGVQPGELVLTLTANLSREVVVSPPQVAFSTAAGATHTLTITDTRPTPLTVLRAVTTSPHLTAAVAAPAAGADGVRRQAVTITLAAGAPAGEREETVVLQTADAAYPEFRVPVRVRVRVRAAGGLVVTPEAVAVRLTAAAPEVSTLVQLRSPDGTPIRVLGVVSDSPAVTARWPDAAAPVTAVRVTVAATQPGEARLRVRLADRPPGEEVVIPVSWTDAGRGPN